jgi:Ran GTPase-activating protein (RanGAP) involved in mRNA processing and transport
LRIHIHATHDRRVLSVLSLKSNSFGVAGGKALAKGLKGNSAIKELNIANNQLTNCGRDMSGMIALADALLDMGALSVLSLKSNGLLNKESGKALADALKGNSILTELDISNNYDLYNSSSKDGSGFAQELAAGIRESGAISSVNLLMNGIGADQAHNLASILTEHPTLKSLCGNKGDETELDMSGKRIGAGGAIMLAPEIIDNGALSVASVMGNRIGEGQLAILQDIMRAKSNLVSLCGIADDATEADLSGLKMDADDAAVLAAELPGKGTLTKLDITSNYSGAAQGGGLQHICAIGGIDLVR